MLFMKDIQLQKFLDSKGTISEAYAEQLPNFEHFLFNLPNDITHKQFKKNVMVKADKSSFYLSIQICSIYRTYFGWFRTRICKF